MTLFCTKCNRTISPSSMSTTIMGNNYHTYCLTCSTCKKPLWNKPFRQTKEGLFCDGDCEAENISNSPDSSLVLPPINNSQQQQRQPLKANQNAYMFYGKNPIYGKEDSVSNLLKQHDFEPNSTQIYYNNNNNNTVNGSSRNAVAVESHPTSVTRSTPPPPPQPIPLPPPSMPLPNEQIEIYSMQSRMDPNKQFVNQAYVNQSPRYQYNLTNPIETSPIVNSITDRQNTNNLITLNQLNHQNSFLSVHRNNPLNASQSQIAINKPYTDYISFYASPISEKDFDTTKANYVCARCNKKISKEKCSFNDKDYHQSCFRCLSCNIELYNMKKVLTDLNDQGYYCEPCYSKNFGPRCGKCSEPVTPYMLSTNFNGTLFHRECLSCARCKKPLAELEFKKSGKIYICRNCY